MKWIPHFLSPNRTQTHNTSLSFCSNTTPKWLLLSPHPPFSRLISPVLMALNKVKEAVQPSSWKKRQREKNESTHWSTGLRPEVAALPLSLPPPPPRLRWRRPRHHPGDSWGWWRRWWTPPAPRSQPWWCWCRSPRAAAIGSTASCRARP